MIYYKAGYKYQLNEIYRIWLRACPEQNVLTKYISFLTDGYLVIKDGYAWDGPSGPTVDTKSFMRGSLVHDALYQLIRMDLLDQKKWKEIADLALRRICTEDGMWKARAWLVYKGVAGFAGSATMPGSKKKLLEAP